MESGKVVPSSSIAVHDAADPVDRLSPLLARFRVRASLFHTGALCGVTRLPAQPGRAFLHVLRRGDMQVLNRPQAGGATRLHVAQPMLLFYPRPFHHEFINPPREGSDLTCATLDFDGGERNPLVAALPPFIGVPLAEVDGLRPTLELLFAEADRARCGSRLIADRLFEVVLIQLLRWIVDHPQQAGVGNGLLAGLSDLRLARALVALHRSPGEAWSLARMAMVAGMSRSAFAQVFRATMGTTPAAYLADWRVTLAASMVRHGRPVKLVATELGFAGPASLSKAFRQRLGVSPREWLMDCARAGAPG